MEPVNNTLESRLLVKSKRHPGNIDNRKGRFSSILNAYTDSGSSGNTGKVLNARTAAFPQAAKQSIIPDQISKKAGIAAYTRQEKVYFRETLYTDIAKYKEDQLLSNPGGDNYPVDRQSKISAAKNREGFMARVGKDLSGAFGNIKNFFSNLVSGAKFHYRDKDNQIKEAQKTGLLTSVGNFFKGLGSAVSFGKWRPDGEAEPRGFAKRCGFVFNKIKEAFLGDLACGVGGSTINMGEDILLAGWNLAETIPDATIGNLEEGRKLTTAVFDNGQVILDGITDVLPLGEGWQRAHAMDLKKSELPLVKNLNMPEQGSDDPRWRYVRNTPFRKAIETVGSLISDVLSLRILGQWKFPDENRHHKN
jgi:hypothetical protein